jgi:hypothetical protein
MEILEELKHGWGVQRKDPESIKKKALECYKDDDYKNVIELCSKLNWQEEAFDSELGYALCYSIWREPGNDLESMQTAKKCVEYYDEPKFKEICSYAQEHWALQSLKDAKGLAVWQFVEKVQEDVIKYYESALTWQHNNEVLKKRIKKRLLEAYDAIGEKYYDASISYNDNWKERQEKFNMVGYAIPWYKEAGNKQRILDMECLEGELAKKILKDNEKFGKPLNEFPDASGFCNKLIKAGYITLGAFLKASDAELDRIPKIGPGTMNEIKAFRAKF